MYNQFYINNNNNNIGFSQQVKWSATPQRETIFSSCPHVSSSKCVPVQRVLLEPKPDDKTQIRPQDSEAMLEVSTAPWVHLSTALSEKEQAAF